jgi:hypothetical protein
MEEHEIGKSARVMKLARSCRAVASDCSTVGRSRAQGIQR